MLVVLLNDFWDFGTCICIRGLHMMRPCYQEHIWYFVRSLFLCS